MHSSPIFIGGLMKSGTSLLRALVANHPHIFGGLETAWFEPNFQNNWQDAHSQPAARLQTYFDLSTQQYSELTSNCSTPEKGLSAILQFCTQNAKKNRWVEKTPGNVWHLDEIRKNWPEAPLLHVVRDPLDVYASWKKNKKYDLATFISHVDRVVDTLGELLGTRTDQYLEVGYRSLVTTPRETMTLVMDFLEEPWDERVAQNTKGREEFEKVRAVTGKASPTLESLSKPIFMGSLDQWKEILVDQEVNTIRTQLSGYYEKILGHLGTPE